MWFDRLTQKSISELPDQIAHGRFQWQGKGIVRLNGHSNISDGDILIGDGADRCQLNSKTYSFLLPKKNTNTDIDLFNNAITTIGKQLEGSRKLISPMLPAAVVDSESQLLPFEALLEETIGKGHLHQISRKPRIDIRYDEVVTDVARAKRLAKGALVHLASHSECWQRQTLSGIVPKKVKARFSEDDFNIYDNIVYARLLDKLDKHLNSRIHTIERLNDTLEEALEFYGDSAVLHHQLQSKICSLWGQTFDAEATADTLQLLVDTLTRLKGMYLCIRNLKQSGLYLSVAKYAQVGHKLHRTNILNHDPHYRHLVILWDELSKHQQKSARSPSEAFQYEQKLACYYSQFSGLVLQQAMQRYLDESNKGFYFSNGLSFEWAGRTLSIKNEQHDWKLILSGPGNQTETLLHIVPWLNFTDIPDVETISDNTLIAWPGLNEIPTDHPSSYKHGVAISPMDLYCIERLGWHIDKRLNQILLERYGDSIEKIPKQPAHFLKESIEKNTIQLDESHPPELKILEDLDDEYLNLLTNHLEVSNAKVQAQDVIERVMEIRSLAICPVCESKNNLQSQTKGGFQVQCPKCNSRYLRRAKGGQEYEIKMLAENIGKGFSSLGRWFQFNSSL